MNEKDDFLKNFIEKVQDAIDRGVVVPDKKTDVLWHVHEGSVTFENVPFITFDADVTDTRWYCLAYEAERVIVAYLKHPDVITDGDPITLDYGDVAAFVDEMGLLR